MVVFGNPLAFLRNLFCLSSPVRAPPARTHTQLVIAGDLDGSLDDRGRHSSVLVHRVRDWTEWNARRAAAGGNVGGGGGGAGGDPSRAPPGVPPLAGGAQERFVDQRRYANISRCVCVCVCAARVFGRCTFIFYRRVETRVDVVFVRIFLFVLYLFFYAPGRYFGDLDDGLSVVGRCVG